MFLSKYHKHLFIYLFISVVELILIFMATGIK